MKAMYEKVKLQVNGDQKCARAFVYQLDRIIEEHLREEKWTEQK